jgi:Fe-S cluster assembly protein SufD
MATVTDFAPLPEFKGQQGWEFTPLKGLDVDSFAPAPGGSEAGDRALFSFDAPVAEGAIVVALHDAPAEIVEQYLGTIAKDSPLVARNAALWTDGTLVYVPRNVVVEAPILLTHVLEQAGSALHTRVLVVLEEGAQAEVWEQTVSADDESEGLVNTVVELAVGPGARLRYVGGQDVNENTWVFGSQRAIVQRDGHLDWIVLGFGGKNGKVFVETKLAGPGAHGGVTGAYATRNRQHVDYDTLQEHAAPNTTSDLAFRGILDGRSTAVWRGMIQVDEGAQKTDAFQESRNLILGKKAHADAIPGLEILADDVRCTHAAAIAKIDDEQVFYLRSHGLPVGKAQRLVVEGFLEAINARFEAGPVREHVGAAIEKRLALVLG